MKTRAKKFAILGLVLLLAMLGGGYGAYKGYKSVRQTRLIKKAKDYMAASKDRNALLCLQRALRYNGKDIEACRMMAQLAEKSRSPSALIWRSKIVELNPKSLEDRLSLAQVAMVLRDYSAATNALEGVDAADKKTAGYHNIAGTVASAAGVFSQAEFHFAEAFRIEPTNPAPQLNLAVVRLHGSNTPAVAEARKVLKALAANPTNAQVRTVALREVTADALRNRRNPEALELSKSLLQQTNSLSTDRLLRLEVLRETKSPELAATLHLFQQQAGTNVASIQELATWQMAKDSPAAALNWMRTLPSEIQTNPPVALIVADCLAQGSNWVGLQKTIKDQNWGELEFIRRAFISRSLRGQDMGAAAKGEWELALKATYNNRTAMAMLLRLCAAWRWESEGEELLWSIVNRYPDERGAFQALGQALYANGRTRPLLSLFSQELKRDPGNLAVKNNLAVVAMLLDAQEIKPHEMARDVYTKAPTNSTYASTYAFSLHLQNKNPEALKVMQTIPPKDLENPSIAGYYGLILKTAGDKNKARSYLDWAFKAKLLPEERKLFERAKAGV